MDADATWTPGPDGWERARREALAEEGLRHMDRMRDAILEHARAKRAVDALIAEAGGDPEAEAPAEVEGEDDDADDDGWRAYARRWIRKQRETFRAVAEDGRDPLPPERRELLLAAGVPASQLTPWPPTPSLEAKVAEAERWADVAEEAVP